MNVVILSMIVAITIALITIGITWWRATLLHRERQRIAAETLLTQWQLRTMTRAAMQQMLDTARERAAGHGDR